MSDRPVALVAAAPAVPADDRSRFRDALEAAVPAGIVLATCHRTELHATAADLNPSIVAALPPGGRVLEGPEAVRHLASVAIGLESAILAEDQVLHQLRAAVSAARARGPLPRHLDRASALALAAGRRARSWRQSAPRSLADVALEEALERVRVERPPVLVVGAGRFGRLAARAAARRGCPVAVASRTLANAAALAHEVGGEALPLGVGPSIDRFGVVIVALAGPWALDAHEARRLDGAGAAVVDLSAPRAVPDLPHLARAGRLLLVDDLAAARPDAEDARLRPRLERLVRSVVGEYEDWSAAGAARAAASALATRAEVERRRALDRLWGRLPDLGDEERAAIEAMSRHLTDDLLREPIARLRQDGRHEATVRELFGL